MVKLGFEIILFFIGVCVFMFREVVRVDGRIEFRCYIRFGWEEGSSRIVLIVEF